MKLANWMHAGIILVSACIVFFLIPKISNNSLYETKSSSSVSVEPSKSYSLKDESTESQESTNSITVEENSEDINDNATEHTTLCLFGKQAIEYKDVVISEDISFKESVKEIDDNTIYIYFLSENDTTETVFQLNTLFENCKSQLIVCNIPPHDSIDVFSLNKQLEGALSEGIKVIDIYTYLSVNNLSIKDAEVLNTLPIATILCYLVDYVQGDKS